MRDPLRDSAKPTVVGAALGVLLLGAVVAFAVAVPDDDQAEAAGTAEEPAAVAELEPVALPESLPPGLVAVDAGTLPAELASQFGDVADLKAQQDSIGTGLESLFGVPGAFRLYAAEDGSALVSVTVLDRAPGLYVPEAPPVDPATIGLARPAVELVKLDDAVCSLNWGTEVPAGQPVDPAADPQAVRCQVGAGERTFEISAQGLSREEVTTVLDAVVTEG